LIAVFFTARQPELHLLLSHRLHKSTAVTLHRLQACVLAYSCVIIAAELPNQPKLQIQQHPQSSPHAPTDTSQLPIRHSPSSEAAVRRVCTQLGCHTEVKHMWQPAASIDHIQQPMWIACIRRTFLRIDRLKRVVVLRHLPLLVPVPALPYNKATCRLVQPQAHMPKGPPVNFL
jgi:hypothetical protein